MKVSDIVDYLFELERTQFTGAVTLNFHKGDVSSKFDKKIIDRIKQEFLTTS